MTTDRADHPLLALLAPAIESAIARALALDPTLAERLQPFEGRQIALEWQSAGIGLGLAVEDGRVRVGPPPARPDLALRGSLAGAVKLAFDHFGARGFDAPGKVEVAGDVGLARELGRLVAGLELDAEAGLARVVGPVLGPQLARGLGAGLAALKRALVDLASDAADYVRDESRDVVGGAELDAFHAEVDRLRDATERLAARIERLRQAAGGEPG